MFDVDLVFTADMPDNVRVGKSFRVQIELGQPEQAIVLSRGNFYQSTGGQWIYKLNASKTKATRVPVSIGGKTRCNMKLQTVCSPEIG